MEVTRPSLPSNYVTFLQLKERWLQQQQQQQQEQSAKSSHHHHQESESQPTHKPEDDSASSIPNGPVLFRRNRPQGIYQVKQEVRLRDSPSKPVVQVVDNHPKLEKQDHNTDQSKNNSSAARNPRFANNQNQTRGSTPVLEPEPVQEWKQKRDGRHRNRDVLEPKGKTPPLAQNLDGLSHNDSGGDDVVEPIAAVAKETGVSSVSKGTNRRLGSGTFNGVKANRPSKSPSGTTPPFAQNVNVSSRNVSSTDGVVKAVAAAVNEINVSSVSQVTNRRGDSRRFHGGHKNRPSKPPIGKTPPLAVGGSSHSDSGGDGVVEAVTAAVKEISVSDVSQGTSKRFGSGRFYRGPRNGPWKPPFGVKRGQMSAVWVRKGESAPN